MLYYLFFILPRLNARSLLCLPRRSANVAGDTARLFELPAQSKQFRAPVAERLAAPVSSAAEIAAVRAHAEALCKSVSGMEVKPVGDLVVAMPFS